MKGIGILATEWIISLITLSQLRGTFLAQSHYLLQQRKYSNGIHQSLMTLKLRFLLLLVALS